jgi:hypothetical protein
MQKSECQDLHILNLFGETSYLNAICLELPELTRIYSTILKLVLWTIFSLTQNRTDLVT